MKLEENISLASFTTFKIGGKARYFTRVREVAELEEVALFAQKEKLPLLVLGGGSNVLLPDEGFSGVVVKMDVLGIEFNETKKGTEIVVGAGESWDELVALAAQKELWGLENLSGIPGTVGGTPIQNIGAYGVEVAELIVWVEVFDPKTGSMYRMKKNTCKFGYRDSVFKHKAKHLVVTRACFLLAKKGLPAIEYRDLREYFAKQRSAPQTPSDVRAAVLSIRSKKFPDLTKVGTAGSFFKNPIVSKGIHARLKKRYPDLVSFPAGFGKMKLSLAWIIDHVCDLKGIRVGDAGVSGQQALVLCYFGNATAVDVRALAEKIISSVKEKTGVVVEPEVRLIENSTQ